MKVKVRRIRNPRPEEEKLITINGVTCDKDVIETRTINFSREYDPVNRPAHYAEGGIECIDAMLETQGSEAVCNFCICNAFKYLWRHSRKNGVEDVKKAIWYLRKYLEIKEGE